MDARDFRLSIAATIVAGTVWLAGCSTPTPEPEPAAAEESVAATPEAEATPELITQLEGITWQEFEALPQPDQLAYVLFRLEANAERHASGVGDAERSTWTTPSKEMSGQQIVDNYNYVVDEAGLSVAVSTDGDKVLDQTEAVKLLSGAYYDTASPFVTNAFVSDRDLVLSTERMFITDRLYTVVSESEILAGDDRAGTPTEYKEIVVQGEKGDEITIEFVFVEYTAVDGSPASTWLLYKQTVAE